MNRTVLITGAAGFIGSHLGNSLASQGHTVIGMDNYIHPSSTPRNFVIHPADIRDVDYLTLRAKSADSIIHLAAAINIDAVNVSPEMGYEFNVKGTLNVLEVARKHDLPVVFASSSEVYGSLNRNRFFETGELCGWCGDSYDGVVDRICENHPLDGQSPYSATKIAGDRMMKAWRDTYGLETSIVRLFNTFGPWQGDDSYGGVISKFSRLARAGKSLPIYGDGEQRRDYLYIDDAVRAFELALDTQFPGPVNFSTGTTVTVNEIAAMIGGEAVHGPPRAGEVQCLRGSWEKARGLGWKPTVTFQEGMEMYLHPGGSPT